VPSENNKKAAKMEGTLDPHNLQSWRGRRAGFKGRGQTGQLPRASTKTVKKLLPKEIKILSETDNLS